MDRHRPLQTRLGSASHPVLIGRSQAGLWIARDLDGRSEGIFRDRKAAIRFALSEGGHANAAMLSPDGIESGFDRAAR